jgi:phage-related baseplate assembly protein
MPVPSLFELLKPVPTETVVEQSLAIAAALDLPVTAWQPISVAREIIYINSQLVHDQSIVLVNGPVAGGFLSYATGEWLTLCAYEIFDTERNDASSATGIITLVNASGVPFPVTPGSVRVLNESAQKTYTCSTGGTVPAMGELSTIEFIADEPGSDSNLTGSDILSLVATVPGVTPRYYQDLIGQNRESDKALELRSREANAKASPNGPSDAYEYYAKTTLRPNGSLVGVSRTNKIEGNGTVTMYLADPDGALNPADRDYVFDNVNSNVVPTGFTLLIPSPSCVELPIDLAMMLTPNPESSASHADVESRIRTAVAAYLSSIDIGGNKAQSFQGVYWDTLVTIIRVAAGDDVLSVNLIMPSASVALTSIQAPVSGTFSFAWAS